MGWTSVPSSSVTWGVGTIGTETYSAGAVSRVVWGAVAPQPAGTDNGVDFEYQLRESYPMILSEDRPFLLVSSLSEGQP